MNTLPRMLRIRQNFAPTPPVDIRATLAVELGKLHIQKGAKIAVGVGSRGITNLSEIIAEVIAQLRAAGAEPFIIPARGSHGGATPEGQCELLASYGVTEEAMGVPIRASLETRQVGATADGVPVHCSTDALAADGILLINRIKPHTDFFGALGSGLVKMSVIGLGKRNGAATMHLAATQFGHERVIRAMANVLIQNTPLLGGVAILENQFHQTARLLVIPREEMAAAEDALLVEARALMPLLPFEEIDLLIVDWLGKNISGAGMDPNVINRSVNGYDSLPARGGRPAPFIRRIFVRGLSPESHGNAIGIGMADCTTARFIHDMDARVTSINSLTSLTPQNGKIPITFDSDREAIERMLASLPLREPRQARIARITSTLELTELEVSESLWNEVNGRRELTALDEPREFVFDAEDNLPDL